MNNWELGSEFHWMERPEGATVSWPVPATWYLLGRHAMQAVLRNVASPVSRVWLPSYFCDEVADSLRAFAQVVRYKDDPRWDAPDWGSLEPRPDDVVLAVNYFGIRSGAPWSEWSRNNECILLEDHTHDPHSTWARLSRAAYAIASLRKTMPVPDGAVLWSPTGRSLPNAPALDTSSGSAMKLDAMVRKAEYLKHNDADRGVKEQYRCLQIEGERLLADAAISAVTPSSRAYLGLGCPVTWREQRLLNASYLLQRLQAWRGAKLLFHTWPDGHVPFAVVIVCDSGQQRDDLRACLREQNIFCPVHWPSRNADPDVQDLSARVLSLCIDQRYTPQDMDRLAASLELIACAGYRV